MKQWDLRVVRGVIGAVLPEGVWCTGYIWGNRSLNEGAAATRGGNVTAARVHAMGPLNSPWAYGNGMCKMVFVLRGLRWAQEHSARNMTHTWCITQKCTGHPALPRQHVHLPMMVSHAPLRSPTWKPWKPVSLRTHAPEHINAHGGALPHSEGPESVLGSTPSNVTRASTRRIPMMSSRNHIYGISSYGIIVCLCATFPRVTDPRPGFVASRLLLLYSIERL